MVVVRNGHIYTFTQRWVHTDIKCLEEYVAWLVTQLILVVTLFLLASILLHPLPLSPLLLPTKTVGTSVHFPPKCYYLTSAHTKLMKLLLPKSDLTYLLPSPKVLFSSFSWPFNGFFKTRPSLKIHFLGCWDTTFSRIFLPPLQSSSSPIDSSSPPLT